MNQSSKFIYVQAIKIPDLGNIRFVHTQVEAVDVSEAYEVGAKKLGATWDTAKDEQFLNDIIVPI